MGDLLNNHTLDFEKPVRFLENQIVELKLASNRPGLDISSEIQALQKKVNLLTKEIYGNLTSWEKVQLARHPDRPHSTYYINELIPDFKEISGDRCFANDRAIITGFGHLGEQRVAVVAIEKGRKTKEKIIHNFGMPRPDGYRKALRVMQMAGRFNIPVITFVDTPGAYPGIGAEERGQSSAIAENLAAMFDIPVPIISVVIGEGGSGGALGVAVADKVMMLEYSIYSVISPESCASILWSDPKKAETAANSLQLGPIKAKELLVIDAIIEEPAGGAHKEPKMAAQLVKESIERELKQLKKINLDDLLDERFKKFREMGNQTLVNNTEAPLN